MKPPRIFTGILLIIAPILFMGAFTLLQINFEYPDILRKPAAYVMEQFAAGGAGLIATWYAMVVSAILFIPLTMLLHPWLARQDTWYLPLATAFGVTAGIVQMLGFVRWPFMVPSLAAAYIEPSASDATRAAISVTFSAFNQYAGLGVGEHLGYTFTALWTLLAAAAMFKSETFSGWLGWLGMASAVGILAGVLEPVGIAWAGLVNALAYILWAIWLLACGVYLLRPARRA